MLNRIRLNTCCQSGQDTLKVTAGSLCWPKMSQECLWSTHSMSTDHAKLRNWLDQGLGKARAQVLVVDPIDRFRLIQYGFASRRFSRPSQPIISPHCRPDCKEELFVRLRTALNRFTQALANCRLISGPIPAWEVLSQTSSLDLRPTMGMEWR